MEYQRRGEPAKILQPTSAETLKPIYYIEPLIIKGVPNIIFGDKGVGQLLILSQVILSLQLSFAVVPLVWFTCETKKMGPFVNSLWLKLLAWCVTSIIIGLNLFQQRIFYL